ncbi:MAG: PilN domain-containing protein [Fluviibacter sp.]
MTSRFNLLPHRMQKQMWQKRVLGRQVSRVLLLAFLTALLIHGIVVTRLDYLESYNNSLQSAVTQMLPAYREAQQFVKQRDDMLERQKVLERLDARRSTSVMILDDVARAMLPEVYLTRLEEDGERFRLEGKAVNNAAIANFYESIVKSERLTALALEEIHVQEGESLAPYVFLINGKVRLSGIVDNTIVDPSHE